MSVAMTKCGEAGWVTDLVHEPDVVDTPSQSGRGQRIARCPACHVAVWSHYSGSGPAIKFVRVGTLDEPDLLPPDVHIFVESKQPWVVLPPMVPSVEEFYRLEELWPRESLARHDAILPLIEAYRATLSLTLYVEYIARRLLRNETCGVA